MRVSEHVFMTVLMLRDKATMRAEFSTVTLALMSSSIASNAVRLSARSELHDMIDHSWHHTGERDSRRGCTYQVVTSTYCNAYTEEHQKSKSQNVVFPHPQQCAWKTGNFGNRDNF
jgi:hypothetical protein